MSRAVYFALVPSVEASPAKWRGTVVQQDADLPTIASAVRQAGKLEDSVELHIKWEEAYFSIDVVPAVPEDELRLLVVLPNHGEHT